LKRNEKIAAKRALKLEKENEKNKRKEKPEVF